MKKISLVYISLSRFGEFRNTFESLFVEQYANTDVEKH